MIYTFISIRQTAVSEALEYIGVPVLVYSDPDRPSFILTCARGDIGFIKELVFPCQELDLIHLMI